VGAGMLDYSYNMGLVAASVAISVMAAFTGLWLTRGLSEVSSGMLQTRIAMASVALGVGIWSMHFIAMLAVELPVRVTYQILMTLASLLIAILLAGMALLTMHYSRRNLIHIGAAGAVLGLGIVAMHYTGMAAMELCQPVYSWGSVVTAIAAALVMGIGAIWAAYGHRTRRNLLLGTLVLGSTVVIVHFTAMAGTGFLQIAGAVAYPPTLDQEELALVVLLLSFLICGAFLLSGATFLDSGRQPSLPAAAAAPPAPIVRSNGEAHVPEPIRLPVERRGHTEFIDLSQVVALRAEGHYTIAYSGHEKLFCPWSISEAERRLADGTFFRAHRSYLVNVARVTGFERHRDGGVCLFEGTVPLERVPVSRSRVPALREALGL
jgi:NO-binding membrane sensor protein with MHYT domain